MDSFWNHIQKPCMVLAPMADITDAAYRRLIAQLGKPDAMWTEFVSADGLYHTREKIRMSDKENPLMRDLQFSEKERPIVAQLFSNKPEMMEYAAGVVADLGFDGIDINMGCPDKSIEKQGAGACLIRNPDNVSALIKAAKDGSAAAGHPLPVSVKTRIGYTRDTIDEWIPVLLEEEPAAIIVHLRTQKEMSKVSAHWERMEHIVALRDRAGIATLILGNGDVRDLSDAYQKARDTGADGIMFGRAIFGNPWLFTGRRYEDASPRERLAALVLLASYFEELMPRKPFHLLKKHIKAFVGGFVGASELRAKLMSTNNAAELAEVIASNDLFI